MAFASLLAVGTSPIQARAAEGFSWKVTGPAVVNKDGYVTVGASYTCSDPSWTSFQFLSNIWQNQADFTYTAWLSEVRPSSGSTTITPQCDGSAHPVDLHYVQNGFQLSPVKVFEGGGYGVHDGVRQYLPEGDSSKDLEPVAAQPGQPAIPNPWPTTTQVTFEPEGTIGEKSSMITVRYDCGKATRGDFIYSAERPSSPEGTWAGYPLHVMDCTTPGPHVDQIPWHVVPDGTSVDFAVTTTACVEYSHCAYRVDDKQTVTFQAGSNPSPSPTATVTPTPAPSEPTVPVPTPTVPEPTVTSPEPTGGPTSAPSVPAGLKILSVTPMKNTLEFGGMAQCAAGVDRLEVSGTVVGNRGGSSRSFSDVVSCGGQETSKPWEKVVKRPGKATSVDVRYTVSVCSSKGCVPGKEEVVGFWVG